MCNIRRKDWKNLEPSIYGWGINDVDYKVTDTIKEDNKHKITWICPYYESWRSMIKRCFSSKFQNSRNNYKNCTVTEEWKYLSNFIKWVDSQPNRDWMNCELDKDLILKGNKHYSSETCVYLEYTSNLFISDSTSKRGECMLGVSIKNGIKLKKYRAYCGDPFNRTCSHLGYFNTELEAHKAWQAKKHEYACQLADLQKDERGSNALRERYAPDKDWTNT